jgi:hypothetical protein
MVPCDEPRFSVAGAPPLQYLDSSDPLARGRSRRVQQIQSRRGTRLAAAVLLMKPAMPPGMVHDLKSGYWLGPDEMLSSPKGAIRLRFQSSDGNLILECIDDSQLPKEVFRPYWANGVRVSPGHIAGAKAMMHSDGNFVVSFPSSAVTWATGTNGNPGAFLRCQDDGNLVVYSRDGQPLWASNTHLGPR